MHTTKGEIPESELRKEVTEEPVECGILEKTSYYDSENILVRQDVNVKVDEDFWNKMMGVKAIVQD